MLFGIPVENDLVYLLNFCILLGKYFIYINKQNGINVHDIYLFKVMLKSKLNIERLICIKENKTEKF